MLKFFAGLRTNVKLLLNLDISRKNHLIYSESMIIISYYN